MGSKRNGNQRATGYIKAIKLNNSWSRNPDLSNSFRKNKNGRKNTIKQIH